MNAQYTQMSGLNTKNIKMQSDYQKELRNTNTKMRDLRERLLPLRSAFVKLNPAISGVTAALQLGAVGIGVYMAVVGAAGYRLRGMNSELGLIRGTARSAGINFQWMTEQIKLAELAGARLDATDFSGIGEVLGEAAIDPESEKGVLVRAIGIDAATASAEELYEAVMAIEDANTRWHVAHTLFEGALVEQMVAIGNLTESEKEFAKQRALSQRMMEEEITRGGIATNMFLSSIGGVYNAFSVKMRPLFDTLNKELGPLLSKFGDWIMYSPQMESIVSSLTTITSWIDDVFGFIARFVGIDLDDPLIAQRKAAALARQELNDFVDGLSDRNTEASAVLQTAIQKEEESIRNGGRVSGETIAGAVNNILPVVECSESMAREAIDIATNPPRQPTPTPVPTYPTLTTPGGNPVQFKTEKEFMTYIDKAYEATVHDIAGVNVKAQRDIKTANWGDVGGSSLDLLSGVASGLTLGAIPQTNASEFGFFNLIPHIASGDLSLHGKGPKPLNLVTPPTKQEFIQQHLEMLTQSQMMSEPAVIPPAPEKIEAQMVSDYFNKFYGDEIQSSSLNLTVEPTPVEPIFNINAPGVTVETQ